MIERADLRGRTGTTTYELCHRRNANGDILTPSYKLARKYMIRLEREDFTDEDKLRQMAQAASSAKHFCSPEQFRDRFHSLTTDLRGCS